MQQRRRKQTGVILQISGRWYVRYYQRQTINGVLERRRVTHCLGEITTRGKTPPAEIVTEAERHMTTVNGCSIPVNQVLSLAEFAETVFLPRAEKRLKASTYRNYEGDWQRRIKPLVARDRKNLKDYRTFDVQRWLDHISRDGTLAKNSLKGIKAFLSGLFKEARRLGYYDGPNPAQDTRVNPDAAEPEETYAYVLEEIADILSRLPEPAATMFAIAAYAGLRRGEIEGLEWTDYYEGELHVCRSIWNGEVVTPKTKKSAAAVPVIKPLAERLEMHHLRCGEPTEGWIFSTSNKTPLSLHNTVNRQILPALNRCVHCGLSEGLPHLKAKDCLGYERDERIPAWYGFHAARRGLGSNLNRLGVNDSVIQRILRHSNVTTTLKYYVKTTPDDATRAMATLENNLPKSEGQKLRDTYGTPKPDSGATPGFVN